MRAASAAVCALILLTLAYSASAALPIARATTTIQQDSTANNDCAVSCALLTWPHTILHTSSSMVLIVGLALEGTACAGAAACVINTVTYGASSLSLIGRDFAFGSQVDDEIWVLGPFSASPGTATITATASGSDDVIVGGSVAYFNVNGIGNFFPATGGCPGSNPSVTASGVSSGDMVVDSVAVFSISECGSSNNYGSVLPAGPNSRVWEVGVSTTFKFDGGASQQPADPTVTNGWTATTPANIDGWVDIAVALSQLPAPIPEYPVGLPILATLVVIGYALIRRRTSSPNRA